MLFAINTARNDMYPQYCMVINSNVCSHFFPYRLTMTGAISRNVSKIFSSLKLVADNLSLYLYSSQLRSHWRLEMKFYSTYIYTYIHNFRLRPTCVHIYVPPTKILVTDTSQFSWVHGLKGYINFIPFHLMQILYLVGVGLLLNVDLACTESQGWCQSIV